MWLVDLNYIFECDWLIKLSENKLSNNKLTSKKLSYNNLARELVENRTFFETIASEEIVIFIINNGNRTEWSPIRSVIISITKVLIMIGSPRAYLKRKRRAITWVSDYRCPIWPFSNWTPVIGYPRDFPLNYARFNGFLSNVIYSFRNLG